MSIVQPTNPDLGAPRAAAATADRSVILVLESVFPARGGGGAESQVLTLGKRLQSEGVRVVVVVPRVAHGPQAEHDRVEGLEVIRIAYPRVRLVGGLVMLAKLAALLWAQRRHYGVIHAHIAHNMAAVATLAGRVLGKRVVVKITGMRELEGGILDPRAGLASRIRRAVIKKAELVQATSARIGEALRTNGFRQSRTMLLPNAVDCDRFRCPRPRAGGPPVVGIYVGRLVPEKGHDLLLRAWARSLRGRKDMRLVLVGDGVLAEPLRALCAELGIADQVVFAGHRSDVTGELAAADFALLTSLAEGLSNSMLEYMAAGLPVVGSRVSGTEDFVVPGKTGWLVEPGELEALADALAAVARTSPAGLQAMGELARERVVAAASIDAVCAKLLACYGFTPGRGG